MNRPQNAAALAANLRPQPVAEIKQGKTVQIDPATRAVIDDLFVRLKGIYSAWKQAWPSDVEENAAKREWLAALMVASIRSMDQIQHGLRMARASGKAFVSSPGEFVDWCFAPEAFGLPPLDKAYAIAMSKTYAPDAASARWKHAAIYHAAAQAGFSTLQQLPRADGLKLFGEKYLEQCRKLGRGEQLAPVPVAALPEPSKCTEAGGKAGLAMLRAALRGKA